MRHALSLARSARSFSSCCARRSEQTDAAAKNPSSSSRGGQFSLPPHLDIKKLPRFMYDDVDVTVHQDLERQREILHFRRLINYQLPTLKEHHEKFIPPEKNHCVRVSTQEIWDMDDPDRHDKARIARITVSVAHLPALSSDAARHKFRVLAGERWNSDSDSLELECGSFPIQAMNESWCSDVLDRLVQEANNQTDTLADVPVDTRPTEKQRKRPPFNGADKSMFPKEWL